MATRRRTTGNQRVRPVAGRRTTSKKKSSGGGYTPIVITAIIIAGVIGFWKPIKKMVEENVNKKSPQQAAPAREVIEVKTVVDKDGNVHKEVTKYSPEQESQKAKSDNARAQLIIDDANKRFEAGEFGDALIMLQKVSELDCEPVFISRARKLLDPVSFFADIAKRNPYIKSSKTASQVKEEFNELKVTTAKDSIELWKLAKFALRNNLNKEAAEILQEAWSLDSKFKKNVYEARANMILADAMYYKSLDDNKSAKEKFSLLARKFSRSKASKTAKEILHEERALGGKTSSGTSTASAPAQTSEPVKISVKIDDISDPLEKEAETAYQTGVKLFSRGARHTDVNKGREMIAQSIGKLGEAVKLYEELVKKKPSEARLQERLKQAKVKKIWAGKFNRIG